MTLPALMRAGAAPYGFWYSLTWFGDSGFLLPAALWIAVWLGVRSVTRPIALASGCCSSASAAR